MDSLRWKAIRALAAAVVLAGVVLVATASAGSPPQTVTCVGFKHKHPFACHSSMKLTCHKTTWTSLTHVPKNAFSGGVYRVSLLWDTGSGWRNPVLSGDYHHFKVKKGKFTVPTQDKAVRAEALVNVTTPRPGGQFAITVRCT